LTTYEGKEKEKGAHNARRFYGGHVLEMIAVIGKITAAFSQSAGHTVEVYKAEESMPNFRVFVTTTEEGDHAVVMLRGSKVTVIPLFRETPEKLVWHIEILRKEIPAIEVEVITSEATESDV
jgi:hypothetical protein